MSKNPKVYLVAIAIILVAWGVTKTIQTYRAKETRLQQLQQEHKLLEEAQVKTKVEQENLKKQIEAKDKEINSLKQAKASIVKVAYAKTVVPSGDCAKWMQEAGITDPANAIILINRESGCRWNARNASSGAYGIPQALPGYKMQSAGADWQTNPVTQLKWMQGYVMARYHSWANAVAFSTRNGWY